MNIKKALLPFVGMVFAAGCGAGGLPSFGADIGKQSSPVGDVRVPYTDVASYFGYVAPGGQPDEEVGGKKMYYLYVWIPAVAPEIGVRMISPVASMAKPKDGDFVDPGFTANAASTDYFDTWVRFERCAAAVNPEDITKPCEKWVTFGENDDSSELPANPGGQKYNSVLRLSTDANDPMKAIVRGMYRVGFTTYKVGEVKGTFLAQLGAPVKIPGVQVARTADALAKAVADYAKAHP